MAQTRSEELQLKDSQLTCAAKTSVILPAYNERDRIGAVLAAVKQARLADEIIVVSDGSTDGTYELVAADPDVKAIRLDTNRGKGAAMYVGAQNTDADILLFLDADLVGMDGEKVDALIEPVSQNRADMAIGIFKGGRGPTDLAQFIAPYISGQRSLRRDVFLSIPGIDSVRSGVETAITRYFRSHGLRIERVPLVGCTHYMKEEKLGVLRGFASRLRMYAEIGSIILDGRRFRA
ncbi:MAG: glycosyltransferase family 2 protein [Armatimonadota bacterium]|nr:glycosyltransferase family 2 protein [Armatimonadota bacterium]